VNICCVSLVIADSDDSDGDDDDDDDDVPYNGSQGRHLDDLSLYHGMFLDFIVL